MTPEMLRKPAIKALIRETARVLSSPLEELSIAHKIPDKMAQALRDDVFIFSGFRTYHELKEASELLLDDKGQVKLFNQFYKDVSQIRNKYNRNYLQAEYNFAVGSAQMAAKWAEHEADKDICDLQYSTAGDDKVRIEHAALDGVTLPFDDPFWSVAYPPNGWNCRCTVIRAFKGSRPLANSEQCIDTFNRTTKGKEEIFRYNPGKDKVIFPPHHPYYGKRTSSEEAKEIRSNLRKDISDKDGYITRKEGKAILKVHTKADPSEVEDNTRTGFDLARFDPTLDIRVREHKSQINEPCKNPEFEINGLIADAKRLEDVSGITNGFKAAKEQGCQIVIFDYDKRYKPLSVNYKETARKIANRRIDFESGAIVGLYLVRNGKVVFIPGSKGCDKDWMIAKMQEVEL